jgi:hypothetical protein
MADFLKEVSNYDVAPLFVKYDEIRMCKRETGAEAIRRYNKARKR